MTRVRKRGEYETIPTNGAFCWPGCSSSGVDPVINSPTRRVGISQVVQKSLRNNKQRMETKNMNLELQTQESKVDTLAF